MPIFKDNCHNGIIVKALDDINIFMQDVFNLLHPNLFSSELNMNNLH